MPGAGPPVRAYFDCLNQSIRLECKALLQSLERKHLTLRTRIKRLARRTICFFKSIVVHDTVISLFINHFFFEHKRNQAATICFSSSMSTLKA